MVAENYKTWQVNNDWNTPSHWEGDQVPCPGQASIIPQQIVYLSSSDALGPIDLAEGYTNSISY